MRQLRNRRKCRDVVRIDNEPRDFVALVRHNRFVEKALQRRISQRYLRGNTLFLTVRGKTGELVAGASGRGFRQQCFQVGKAIALRTDRTGIVRHGRTF